MDCLRMIVVKVIMKLDIEINTSVHKVGNRQCGRCDVTLFLCCEFTFQPSNIQGIGMQPLFQFSASAPRAVAHDVIMSYAH